MCAQECEKYQKEHLNRIIFAQEKESQYYQIQGKSHHELSVAAKAFEKELSSIIKNMNQPPVSEDSPSIFIADEHNNQSLLPS
jgi:hypothetical protein